MKSGNAFVQTLARLVVLISCVAVNEAMAESEPTGNPSDLKVAERFIDAFYSFDADRLKQELSAAPQSIPEIAYYQGWAEGGNYSIVNRQPCSFVTESDIKCPITVEDDLAKALRLTFNVTDTFHLSMSGGAIRSVRTTSDDPPEFYQAEEWVKEERRELFQEACSGYFAGGPTPQQCVRTMVRGFREFADMHRQDLRE